MSFRWMESGKRVQCLLCALLLAPLSLLGAGCRYNDPSVELLQGELRWMEDQLYEMENNLEQACVDLSRCKSDAQREINLYEEKAKTRSNAGSGDIAPIPQPEIEIPGYEVIGGPSNAPTEIIMPDGSVVPDQPAYPIVAPTEPYALPSEFPIESSPVILSEDDGSSVPTIPDDVSSPVSTPDNGASGGDNDAPERAELPSPGDADVPERPKPDAPKPGSPPSLERNDGEGPGEQAIRLLPREPEKYSIRLQSHVTSEAIRTGAPTTRNVDAHITHVVIKAHRTARRSDGNGHDLEILVQPRNADGNYVSLPATLSVVVIDDNQQGAAARIARWDLDATEASRRFRNTEHGEGMHLEFDWPLDPPNSDKLHMYVRYTTVDGRKLQTHQFLEPLSASKPKDEQWTVVGRTKPADGWRVMTIPIEKSDDERVSQQNQSRVIPASATLSPSRREEEPDVEPSRSASSKDQWTTSSIAPAEPRRMPNITAQPIPKPQTAPIGSGVIPASVPEWSPRR